MKNVKIIFISFIVSFVLFLFFVVLFSLCLLVFCLCCCAISALLCDWLSVEWECYCHFQKREKYEKTKNETYSNKMWINTSLQWKVWIIILWLCIWFLLVPVCFFVCLFVSSWFSLWLIINLLKFNVVYGTHFVAVRKKTKIQMGFKPVQL